MRFYLGTYTDRSSSQGIYQGTLDPVTGRLGPLVLATPADNPSFLAFGPSGRVLYAAEEAPNGGRVQAFQCRHDGSLTLLNTQLAEGTGTCHVSVDSTGRNLLAANYGSGSISCFRLERDGSIGPRRAHVQFTGSGPRADRQEGPHAHGVHVSPDNAFVYACDLGSDHVWSFKFDAATGALAACDPPSIRTPSGSGPRHLAFDRDGRFVWVVNELDLSITVLARNPSTGNLTPLQTIPSVPPGAPAENMTASEIILHPGGQWLYVSNRGIDAISVFAVDSSGRLKFIQSVAAEVRSPRSFVIDPAGRWLIAAGQDDGRIAVFKIDPASGEPRATGQSAWIDCPVCVLFAP